MANSLTAIINGINYQEAIFWWQAARMMEPSNKIAGVTWEDEEVIGFDDIVVEYHQDWLDGSSGEKYQANYIQVKHHVDKRGFLTTDSLIDPTFIGAKSNSLLQKLLAQHNNHKSTGKKATYTFFNTWGLDSADCIGRLIGAGGMIRVEVLFDGSKKGEMFDIRKKWCNHLSIDDDELKDLLQHFRIRMDFCDINTIRDVLNPNFQLAKMIPFPLDKVQTGYYGLITKLKEQKINHFTPESLLEICRRENLFLPLPEEALFTVGIRTFLSGAEKLENEVQEILCLSHLYEGRQIRDRQEWAKQVYPSVNTFISSITAKQNNVAFALDTHLTIAFASGYCMDPKTGKTVSVIQKTQNGKVVWTPQFDQMFVESELYSWNEIVINPSETEIALAVSITHDTLPDVEAFVSDALPSVGRIFHAGVLPGPSFQALQNGAHALHLAQFICQRVNSCRKPNERFKPVHIFMAAPNAFSFFFGQYSRSIGKLVLYELAHFPPEKPGDYLASLTFPHKN